MKRALPHLKSLTQWSKKSYGHLPWRKKRTHFSTLLSEIMLQQTTVGTVLNHFDRFLKIYPSAKKVAELTEEEMQIAWKGLGYYRRARNLRNACIEIQEKFKGQVPSTYEELISINGIGPYTASAVLSIGMNKNYLAIDANIERVVNRLYDLNLVNGPKAQKEIQSLFESGKVLKEMPKVGARDLNEALMDLGRVYCQARRAHCGQCPMAKVCQTNINQSIESYLGQKKKISKTYELELLRVLVKKNGKYLTYKKGEKEWLSGQREVPTFIIRSEDKTLGQYPNIRAKKGFLELPKFKTGITKYKITNYVLEATESEWKKMKGEFEGLSFQKASANLSTASTKTIKKVEKECKPDSV